MDAFAGGGDPGAIDRIGVFLDVDGTLLDLAERPDMVEAPSRLIDDLAAAERGARGALALVSGRPIADLDRLFAPLRPRAAGVHGAELRFEPGGGTVTAPGVEALPDALRGELDILRRDFPETFVENKRFSFAVHYRQAPEAGPALESRLAAFLATAAYPGIKMLKAHRALEVKTAAFDKGLAVAAFLKRAPFRGRTPVFVGDDDTDEAGFAAVTAAGGRAYSVGRRRPGVAGVFESPAAVRDWLAALADGARRA